MNTFRCIYHALLVMLLTAVWSQNSHAVTIYLKWEQELTPVNHSDRWETGAAELDQLLLNFPVAELKAAFSHRFAADPYGLKRVLRLEIPDEGKAANLLERLPRLSGLVYAHPAPQRFTSEYGGGLDQRGIESVPGDPLYAEQWFYPVMQAPSAWDVTRGSSSVVVAVVDNGTDWDHPDLAANIWSNTDEIPANGVDDDQNGFVDDVRGWDFFGNDNDPAPGGSDYHGTHTAGLVAALMDNNRGVVGMAPACELMPIRAGEDSGINYGLEGIVYAAYNGADIISLSWGGQGALEVERDVIQTAQAQGCLVVAAAGNEGSMTPHYPAAYEGVLAVGATNPDDSRASYSNYGTWLTVSAPGTMVLSLTPDGYGVTSGTSMSTPLVAGIAALVKSLYPTWTAGQIYKQIVLTADDVSGKNPFYATLMGSGRVNAYRALTETAPSPEIVDLTIEETSGDFDGRLDPGETGKLLLSLKNNGSAAQDVVVILSCDDFYVDILQNSWNIGSFPASTTLNSGSEFTVSIPPWAEISYEVAVDFLVELDNFYTDSLMARFWIDPSHADHDTGNVILTVTEFGAFGYQHYTRNESIGSGFRYPPSGPNALYHGSIMAGISPTQVSDCAYGNANYTRFDWSVSSGGELSIFPGTLADQESIARYSDAGVPSSERVGLEITQHSYSWGGPPYNDFVILSFWVKNVSGALLEDVCVGLYLDWNLSTNYDARDNSVNWDADRNLGYAFSPQQLPFIGNYYGSCLLSGTALSFRAIDLENDVPSGLTDEVKYEFMSAGFVKTASISPADHATLLTASPFSLVVEDSARVVFAVLGGDDLTELKNNANAAQEAWNNVTSATSSPVDAPSGGFSLGNVYPCPANGNVRLSFNLPGPGEVVFRLVDVLGRSAPVWQGAFRQGGQHSVVIPEWNGASGVYLLLGETPYGSSWSRIVWIK
ncbi:MAG: S8 family serine peptidase [bacterium]